MNASMARRIRRAESSLIYAIGRQYGKQREQSQAAQSQSPRDPIPGCRPEWEQWKPGTGHEIRVLRSMKGRLRSRRRRRRGDRSRSSNFRPARESSIGNTPDLHAGHAGAILKKIRDRHALRACLLSRANIAGVHLMSTSFGRPKLAIFKLTSNTESCRTGSSAPSRKGGQTKQDGADQQRASWLRDWSQRAAN